MKRRERRRRRCKLRGRRVAIPAPGSPAAPTAAGPGHREHVPGYRGGTLRRDLLAGVTVAALALPASLAYAEIAGLSPVIGLYALLLPAVAYALFGSSRQVIVGPDGSVAALVGAAVIPLGRRSGAARSLAALLALLVGACSWGLGWPGWAGSRTICSRPVLIGYIHGVAVVLIIGQLGKLLGLSISAEAPPAELLEVIREIDRLNWTTFAVGVTCLAVLLLLRLAISQAPGPLIVVVLAIVVSAVVGLANGGGGGRPYPARLAQPRSARLSADGRPHSSFPAAVGIFFVAFLQRDPRRLGPRRPPWPAVHANTELAAMGAANLAAGISQVFPVGASGSRTSRQRSDGRPHAALRTALCGRDRTGSAVPHRPVAVSARSDSRRRHCDRVHRDVDLVAWRGLARLSRVEVAIAAITMVGVISVGVLRALLTGCRALRRRRGSPQRNSTRRGTRLGRAIGPIRRRTAPSDRPDRSRSIGLSAR